MTGIGEPSGFAEGEEDLIQEPFANIPQKAKDAASQGKDAVMAALEDPKAVVDGWREQFEGRVEDVTDPEWNMTEPDTTAPVLEAPNSSEYYSAEDGPNADEAAGGEVIDSPSPMPSSLDTQEQVDDYTQNTLISPETASANGTGDLDMRLAS